MLFCMYVVLELFINLTKNIKYEVLNSSIQWRNAVCCNFVRNNKLSFTNYQKFCFLLGKFWHLKFWSVFQISSFWSEQKKKIERKVFFSGSITAQRGLTTLRIKWKTFVYKRGRKVKQLLWFETRLFSCKRLKHLTKRNQMCFMFVVKLSRFHKYVNNERDWMRKLKF